MMDASLLEVIGIGLKSWGLLALGLVILFIVLLILNALTGNKKDKSGK